MTSRTTPCSMRPTKKFMEGFGSNAHPMAMLVSTVAALSTVYPDAKHIHDPENRLLQIKRLIGKMPSIVAMSYRHMVGFPYIYPDNDLSYPANFMNMLWKMVEPKYLANPVIARALDILFILHADHEQNCSQRHARRGQFPKRPVPGHGRCRRRSFRSLARRGERRGAAHAGRDRFQGKHPRLRRRDRPQSALRR